MPRVFRSSFNSGVLSPLLAARADLDQYRAGLVTGENVLLLPHGGLRRRPGLRFIRAVDERGRLARFRFSANQQYLLHFRDQVVDVCDSAGIRLTHVPAPWTTAELPELYTRAQAADTMVLFHQHHAPRRILRAALRGTNPVRTYSGQSNVRIYQPAHDLLTGDALGLSDLTSVGGLDADQYLNQPHQALILEGPLGANPLSMTSGSRVVVLELGALAAAQADFEVGDTVELAGLPVVRGIPANQLNRVHDITAVAGTTVSFEVDSQADSTGTGGGSGATWKATSFFEVDIFPTTASSSADGGGPDGKAWILHSLAPDEDRKVAFKRLPQFDFLDSASPPPKTEIQKLTFTGFVTGEWYQLKVEVPPIFGPRYRYPAGLTIQTNQINWTASDEQNARNLQAAINDAVQSIPDVCAVEYKATPSPHYLVRFLLPGDFADIQVFKLLSTSGTIVVETVVEGGSREEDVISDVRGWPAGGIFHQRRLWLFGLASRPSTLLASQVEEFFDFEVGTALDGEAISATGEFDQIRHLIAERGLIALTSSSEVAILGGADDGAVTPSNIALKVFSRYGATTVQPRTIGGRPVYVDAIERNVRMVSDATETGLPDSDEISIMAQHLIDSPTGLEVWRNGDGDYLLVCNQDGTLAVLNMNVAQGVVGWTRLTTRGRFLELAEVADQVFAVVERTVGGEPQLFLERFDFSAFTDSAVLASLNDGVELTGLSHLDGEVVHVRADEKTMDPQEVAAGSVPIAVAGVPTPSAEVEAGLPVVATVEPTPPQLGEYTSIVKATVDLFESRAVRVGGYRLRDYAPGQAVTDEASPLITGLRSMQLRGWGERKTVTITSEEPQPMTLRAIEMETA